MFNKKSYSTFIQVFSSPLFFALLLAGCGKQSFKAVSSITEQKAKGTYSIAPKIDILLAQDDTGSMYEIYEQVQTQMPAFLSQLESQGWDYHFATTPLTQTDYPIRQVMASKHDSNWQSEWSPAYPGMRSDLSSMLAPEYFTRPSHYGEFIQLSQISNGMGGAEDGFESIRSALFKRLVPSRFLRKDAMLMVIVMSNGDDTSGITYCVRPSDNVRVPCEYIDPTQSTTQQSFQFYVQELEKVKPNRELLKFHSLVSHQNRSLCLGGKAYAGSRYQSMSSHFGSPSYDICTTPLKQVLDSIASHLKTNQEAFVTRYLFLEQEPNPDTLRITVYRGGNKNAPEELSRASDTNPNGFRYHGYAENLPSIEYPAEIEPLTGYAIELLGSAKISADDKVDISYQPAGLRDSAAK